MTEEKKGTELAVPATFEETRGMAKAFFESGMFSDTKSMAQAIVKIQAGAELGLLPVYSMQNINLIRSRLTTSANTMAMLVKKSGRYNYRIKEHTEEICTIIFYERDGDKWVEVGLSSFSMADAKRAELVKPDSGWVKFPRAMLFSRAISQGARIYAPDAIGGIYTDEEIRSIPDRPKEDKELEAPKGEEPELPTEPPEEGEISVPSQEIAKTRPDITEVLADIATLQKRKLIAWRDANIVNRLKALGAKDFQTIAEGIAMLDKEHLQHLRQRISEGLELSA